MKANAPERLYLSKTIYSTYLYQVPDPDDETAVEYTRIDAFIDKAVSYLEGTLFNEVCYGEIRPDIVQAYIDDFKKTMRV